MVAARAFYVLTEITERKTKKNIGLNVCACAVCTFYNRLYTCNINKTSVGDYILRRH